MPIKQKNSIRMMNYKIVNKTNDEGEIIFYGEVVEEIPRDWWTDEPVDGMYIALNDFMKDLEQIKNKDKITIRINSVGGDFNTGVVIHNLLKNLKAYKTGIIDGLCASAATLIACACDELHVFPSSRFMIHDAQAGLCGWFTKDKLTKVCNQLVSTEESMAQIYIAKCQKSEEEILNLTNLETWFVGQKIIDNGFADKLISDEKRDVNFKIENNGKILVANGVKHDISAYKNFPQEDLNLKEESLIEKITNKVINSLAGKQETAGVSEINNTAQKTDIQEQEGGTVVAKTVEELKTECPELVAQIENAAKTDASQSAVVAERQRIQEIEAIEASIGDQELINAAKYGEKACSASELALQALQKQSAIGKNHLDDINADTTASKTKDVVATANDGNPENVADEAMKKVNLLDKAFNGGNK